jgi:hypothetical protein
MGLRDVVSGDPLSLLGSGLCPSFVFWLLHSVMPPSEADGTRR